MSASEVRKIESTDEWGRGMADDRDNGCRCQRCGRRYKVDFMLPDVLWAEIHDRYNLLCGNCMVLLIENRGQFDYFEIMRLIAKETVTRTLTANS